VGNEKTGNFHHRGPREHRDGERREVPGKNEKTRSFHHRDRIGAGAGHRKRRDEKRREPNKRREAGERSEGTFVRRREHGETFVR